MTTIPHLVGMVHLLPLPGSPRFGGSMREVVQTAVDDAGKLAEAGFPALMIENFGDMPFHPDSVPPETVSSMTAAVVAVQENTGCVIGVNVLRNDARSALAIAAATGAAFIRVNVLIGIMHTDQGPITGAAAAVARVRAMLCPEVEIWADVMVKHATSPPGVDPAGLAHDTVARGMADAVIVSGSGTGLEPDIEMASVIANAVPMGTRVVIGSGATASNLGALMEVANTVIVGSSVKISGDAGNRVDPERAHVFAVAAEAAGLG